MTAVRLAIRWTATEVARDRAAVAALLGVDIPASGSIELPGLRLEIVGTIAGAPRGRLELVGISRASPEFPGARLGAEVDLAAGAGVEADAAAGISVQARSTAAFLALGWATVDLERSAATWPGVRWHAASRDALIGATALVGRAGAPSHGAPEDAITIVLLEPDSEGRLAASLARHGEGPSVLYLRVRGTDIAAISARLAPLGLRLAAGTGPFGPGWAIVGLAGSSPSLILVTGGGAG